MPQDEELKETTRTMAMTEMWQCSIGDAKSKQMPLEFALDKAEALWMQPEAN